MYEVDYLLSNIREKLRIDPVSLLSLESFTGELEEDSFWIVIFLHTLE